MVDKIKQYIYEARRGLVVVTFGLVLYCVLMHVDQLFEVLFSFVGLLRPMVIGLAFAYILNLPMAIIEKFIKKNCKQKSLMYRKSRGISITITLILAIILIVFLFAFIVPQLINSLILLFSNFGNYITNIVNFFIKLLDGLNIDSDFMREQLVGLKSLPWDEVFTNIVSWLGNASSLIGNMASDVVNRTMGIIGELGVWLTAFMVSLYLLSGKEQFLYQARKIVIALVGQKISKPCFRWANIINRTFSNFIGGQLLEAIIIFAIYAVSMTILRFPYALLISALIGITSIIPVFGAMLGSGIGCVLIFAINPWQAVEYYIFYQLMQQFENNVIYPRVVGDSVGLPGVWVIVSIMAFGSVFGIIGMFIAVPTSAVIYQAISELVEFGIQKRRLKLNTDGFIQEEKIDEN